ncbi:MAG: ferredoxin Fer [Halalkalicoccus sp.]
MESPFDVLGIEPGAGPKEVERAYRRRVLETHPDHGGSSAAFQRVRAAYEAIEAADPSDIPEIAAEESEEDEQSTPDTRVEYLNYEVLDDFGWSLEDEDLFEKASESDLDTADYGRIVAEPGEALLEAAENRGFEWPYACRGGACANCAVAVCDGELSMPVNHILPPEMIERGYRLSCNGEPTSETMRVVYNVKHLPGLDELRLPPRPFERAYSD